MKQYLLFFLLFLSSLAAGQNCDLARYRALIREARESAFGKNPDYQLAVNKLLSAKACQPDSEAVVNLRLVEVFKEVNRQREVAVRNEQEAQRQTSETIKALNREELLRKKAEKSIRINRMAVMAMDNKNVDFTLAWHQSIWAYKSSIDSFSRASSDPGIISVMSNIINDKENWLYKDINVGHSGEINSINISPCNRYLIIGGVDNKVSVYDLAARKSKLSLPHNAYLYDAVFSPNENFIVTLDYNDEMHIYDTTGVLISKICCNRYAYKNIIISPNSKIIVSNGDSNDVNLWRKDGSFMAKLKGHRSYINFVCFSHDSEKILTSSNDSTIILWDTLGRQLLKLIGHKGEVFKAIFSNLDDKILSCGADSIAILWNNKGEILNILRDVERIWNAKFSFDGEIIVTSGQGTVAKLWDKNGNFLKHLEGHTAGILNVDFAPSNDKFATSGYDKKVYIWDKAGNKIGVLIGNKRYARKCIFSTDGEKIFTLSEYSPVKEWMKNLEPYQSLKIKGQGIPVADVSTDGSIILVCYDDVLYKLNGFGRLVKKYKMPILPFYINISKNNSIIMAQSLDEVILFDTSGNLLKKFDYFSPYLNPPAFSPDGKKFVIWENNRIGLWGTNGKRLNSFFIKTGQFQHAAFLNDGYSMVTCSSDDSIRIWNTNDNSYRILKGSSLKKLVYVQVSPNGNYIMGCSLDSVAQIWNLSKGDKVVTLRHNNQVRRIQFSFNDARIATLDVDGALYLWDTIGNLIKILNDYYFPVIKFCFSSDGKYLLISNSDGSTRLLDSEGNFLQLLYSHGKLLTDSRFLSDLNQIVTFDSDGIINFWRSFDAYINRHWYIDDENKLLNSIQK